MASLSQLQRDFDRVSAQEASLPGGSQTTQRLNALRQDIANHPLTQLNKAASDREEGFLTRFRGAIADQPSVSDIFTRLSQESGLGTARNLATGLRQQALDTEGRLSSLPEGIRSETRGFDVNANQLARITASRQAPVAKTLTEQSRSAERAGVRSCQLGQEVGQQLQLNVAQQEKELRPFQEEARIISERAAREMTGYTADLQAETSILLQKMQIEGNLDQAEFSRLSQLASAEDEYERRLQEISFRTDESIRGTLATRRPLVGSSSAGFDTFSGFESDFQNFGV